MNLTTETPNPSRSRRTLPVLVAASLITFLNVPAASAQLAREGGSQNLIAPNSQGIIQAVDVGYDPDHNRYLVVHAYGKVLAQWVHPSGAPDGSIFQLGTASSKGSDNRWGARPRVRYSPHANSGNGAFLVSWHQQVGSTNKVHVAVVGYGQATSAVQVLGASSGSHSVHIAGGGAAIAYSSTSQKFYVAWTTPSFAIIGQLVGLNGVPSGTPDTISPSKSMNPTVAWNPTTNQFGVGWAAFDGKPASGGCSAMSAAYVGFSRVRASDGSFATPATCPFGASAGTFNPDADVNTDTGNFVMGWSIGGSSRVAEISSSGQILQTGLLSSDVGTPTSFSLAFNPQSQTHLAVSEDNSKEVVAIELKGNGTPNTTAMLVTSGATTGSFYPRAAARSTAKHWNVAYSRNQTTITNQIVSTTSSNGGGGTGGGTGPFTLTITTPANGKITGPGINCGLGAVDCSEPFASGTVVTLQAQPATGYTLESWVNCTGGSTTMTSNKTCSATFAQSGGGGGGSGSYVLTITPPANGRIITAGITCGLGATACSATYPAGFQVALTHQAAAGYKFDSWTGACAPNGTTSMTSAKTCGASFLPTGGTGGGGGGGGGTGPFTLTIVPPANGRIVTAGIVCGLGATTCSTSYASGFKVALSAQPAAGYVLSGWTGDCAPSGTTTMTGPKTCSATFAASGSGGGSSGSGGTGSFTLTVLNPAVSGGGGIVSGAGIQCYPGNVGFCTRTATAGTTISLTVIPQSGYRFAGWLGCGPTVTLNQNQTCQAVFAKN